MSISDPRLERRPEFGRLGALLRTHFNVTPRAAMELLVVFAVLASAVPNETSLMVGASVSLVGMVLRLWASGYGYRTEPAFFAGPRRFVRHPYFLGSLLVFSGLCLAGRNAYVAVFSLTALVLLYRKEATRDDQALSRRFNHDFDSYRTSVDPFVPQILPGAPAHASNVQFSLKKSLFDGSRSEARYLAGLVVVYALFYVCSWLTFKDLFHLAVMMAVLGLVLGRLVQVRYFGRLKQAG